MHVLILNQTFYPEHAATAQLMWDLAQHLDAAGHRVTAVTSRTIYGTDQRHSLRLQRLGKNIDIIRANQTAFGKKTLPGRLLDFLSFYVSAFTELSRVSRPDVILALTSPPMIAALPMIQRQFRHPLHRRPRLVYHVMDLYPDAAVAMNVMRPRSVPHRVMHRLTRRTLESSDAIIALGRDMHERIIREYDFHSRASRIHVIPPWADGAAIRPMDKSANPLARDLGVQNTFNIVYSGNLGMAHDLQTMIAAIEAMRADADARWLFIGGGNRFNELRQQAEKSNWPNVIFLPYQEREALIHSLNLADVHLVSQLPSFTGIVVPSKLYGILAAGKPSIMIGPADAECARTIEEHQAGYVVPNGLSHLLVTHLRRLKGEPTLRQTLGANARRALESHYDRPIACARIEALLTNSAGD